jgi:DNA polymerase
VLFIGEAPGESEDAVGVPFVPGAPAGHNLQYEIIDQVVPKAVTYAITNLVCCIPKYEDEDGRMVKENPDAEAVDACRPRLEEFVSIVKPRLIVCVGAQARDYLRQGYRHSIKLPQVSWGKGKPPGKPIIVDIRHPANILRMAWAYQQVEFRRCCVTVAKALRLCGLVE